MRGVNHRRQNAISSNSSHMQSINSQKSQGTFSFQMKMSERLCVEWNTSLLFLNDAWDAQ